MTRFYLLILSLAEWKAMELVHFLKYKAGILVSKIRSATNQSHKSESLYCNQMKSNYIMFDICRHSHNPSRQNKYKRCALSFRCTKIVHRLHNDSIYRTLDLFNIRGWAALLNLLVQKLFQCRKSSYFTRYFMTVELGDREFVVLQKRLLIFVKTQANQYTLTVILSF